MTRKAYEDEGAKLSLVFSFFISSANHDKRQIMFMMLDACMMNVSVCVIEDTTKQLKWLTNISQAGRQAGDDDNRGRKVLEFLPKKFSSHLTELS